MLLEFINVQLKSKGSKNMAWINLGKVTYEIKILENKLI